MAKITVVGAVLDRGILSLYQADGSTYVIEQGDNRLADIVRLCAREIPLHGSVEVDVGGEDPTYNAYKEYESKSNGLVRLFKVAKSVLSSFINPQPSIPTYMNVGTTLTNMSPGVAPAVPETKLSAAVEEILAQATPVASEQFNDLNVGTKGNQTDTIIAVVNGQIISGMEQLKPQMVHAAQSDAKGFNQFMKRIAIMDRKRKHSVDDLLKFMQHGDLPIADDGSIVIYKVLRRRNDHYVDCHSGNVIQKVGSYVHMDESLVDHDRRNECSNGLHVARRNYLRNFGGDLCVIAKVAPEDVIAVPEYDANKMRVCGYHILFEISAEAYRLLVNNQPLTSLEADAILLGRALAGDHDEPIEDVKITGSHGSGLQITPRKVNVVAVPYTMDVKPGVAIDTEIDNDKRPLTAAHVDAKNIAKEVTEVKQTTGRMQEAAKLHALFVAAKTKRDRSINAQNLLLFKQVSKVSWAKLGLDDLTDVLKNAIAANG